jgi:uncharacterized protein YoxC
MWLIFIVAVIVLAVLMLFMILAIRMLAGQAKDQLNRYFLKNLETYDKLAENKSREIDELQGTLADLTERVEAKEQRLKQMAESAQSVSRSVSGSIASSSEYTANIASAEYAGSMSGAAYRDPDFLEDYAYVRQQMKLDYRSIARKLIATFDYTESREARLCRSMLEKLPAEHLYDIVTMRDDDQIEYLSGLFNEEEEEYLGEYTKETGQFDLLAFHNYITNYVKDHESKVYLRTGNPEEFMDFENERVSVVRDMGIHEGIRVSYKDTVYDYSL